MGKVIKTDNAKVFIGGKEVKGIEIKDIVMDELTEPMTVKPKLPKISDIINVKLSQVSVHELPKPAPKKMEVQYKCEVCGNWLEAGFFHSSCYRASDTPLLEDPNISDAEVNES